jgi:hypothetical protein
MNKIVHFTLDVDLCNQLKEIQNALTNRSVTYSEFEEIAIDYFYNNFGITISDSDYHAEGTVIDDCKFAVFMLKFPEKIQKTVIDDCKFAVFMLKFPEKIQKIVYE